MIVLLTYDAPHRKTQDVAFQLELSGYRYDVVATPWVDRKPRRFLYAHRPSEMCWPCEAWGDNATFFAHLHRRYTVAPPDTLLAVLQDLAPEVVVVGGAGILAKEIVSEYKVLNVHPGLLPACRGLDTLKWAVHNLKRVGVTAHLCDEYADLGWRIRQVEVPVFRNDTFHAFAMRQYEAELALFRPSLISALNRSRDDFERVDKRDTEPTRRMPRKIESGLLEDFERFKRLYAK